MMPGRFGSEFAAHPQAITRCSFDLAHPFDNAVIRACSPSLQTQMQFRHDLDRRLRELS
jgi:hypothetical protein